MLCGNHIIPADMNYNTPLISVKVTFSHSLLFRFLSNHKSHLHLMQITFCHNRAVFLGTVTQKGTEGLQKPTGSNFECIIVGVSESSQL